MKTRTRYRVAFVAGLCLFAFMGIEAVCVPCIMLVGLNFWRWSHSPEWVFWLAAVGIVLGIVGGVLDSLVSPRRHWRARL